MDLLLNTNFDNLDDLDAKILEFMKVSQKKTIEEMPIPSYFVVSTQSAMCCINGAKNLDLSKIVGMLFNNMISSFVEKKNLSYPVQGLVVDNLAVHFDEGYLKKNKRPLIKYMGEVIPFDDVNECYRLLESLRSLKNDSLKKQGRNSKAATNVETKNNSTTNVPVKEPFVIKENENFYNSCSIIIKPSREIKCINVKLFNNGKITLTGSKKENDGLEACKVLLNELKKDPSIFINTTEEELQKVEIDNYKITMINSDFNTHFKIDLIQLLNILNDEKNLFIKFNPEKYRGLIVGFYWNTNKEAQDGRCFCTTKCNGKGCGTGNGNCKKITISIFKSGSVIITGGQLIKQIEDAYHFINGVFKNHYANIIKLSILDLIEEDGDDNVNSV